jgi:hypothetical protein
MGSGMLVRLTRARRWKAGRLLAFVYLLCVLAPTISFALPGSHAASPCLTDASHAPGAAHMHNDAPAPHVHKDGHVHDHSGASAHVNSGDDRSVSTALNGRSVPEKAPHSSDGKCCGLMCLTALPAAVTDLVKPSVPMALYDVEGYRKVTDNAPFRLYHPPIS